MIYKSISAALKTVFLFSLSAQVYGFDFDPVFNCLAREYIDD
jgi:hypothetical protein